ncbi:cupin domain-containing protein [Candidatus Rariloculus sp.]|uniref:cupin domain-containing protein n=1 Tax=Candidatus Rariloculus sp. TaxID=3101265 RepID=UPI003D0B9D99
MKRYRVRWLILALLPAAFAVFGQADEEGFIRLMPGELDWGESDGNSIGFVVLAGDPQQEGFYVIRARFPPGVMSSPHYHPTDRHVTVISGTWHTGTGAEFDTDAMVPLEPGSYMMHPAGAIHYDGAKDEEVIVEIKGIGPAPTIRVE